VIGNWFNAKKRNKENVMKVVYRVLLSIAVILAALLCYSAGSMTGVVAFFVLGIVLEGVFWLGIGKIFRRKAS
jgi:hypothetical protein